MNSRNNRTHRALTVLLISAALSAACKKSPPAPAASIPSRPSGIRPGIDDETMRQIDLHFASDPAGKKAYLRQLEVDAIMDRQSVIDREEMVIPAPAGFQPSNRAREIRLILTIEKPILRKGESPRFRLGLQNVGREPIVFRDGGSTTSSFFKNGAISSINDRMDFILTAPDGSQDRLWTPQRGSDLIMDEIKTPPGLNAAEKAAWIDNLLKQSVTIDQLRVRLQPGETLVTKGDRPGDIYRTLDSDEDFDKFGTYRLQVKFDDRPLPPSKHFLETGRQLGIDPKIDLETEQRMIQNALGPCVSNSVIFKVAQ